MTFKLFLFTIGALVTLSASAKIELQLDSRGQFAGFNAEGLEKLKEIRDALRARHTIFNNDFLGLEAVEHAATVARLAELNCMLYGPPGGAKSGVVEWVASAEADPVFKIQLHQMMTEQPFVGGQNFDEARKGKYVLNTEGALADFRMAYIDEMEKGNPAALASLLSLLNERAVLAGQNVVKAKTETIFAMSNANLVEMFAHFAATGQATTAAAFLNRFHLKAMVYNWLSVEQQRILDERIEKKRALKARLSFGEDVSSNEVFLEPNKVDWDWLRKFTNVLVRPNDDFKAEMRTLLNELRTETNRAVRDSEAAVKDRREPFPYFPSFDFTERLRQVVSKAVYASLMIDFLLSDLANDDVLKENTSRLIELGPLSLWRAQMILTTIGPGEAKLSYNENATPKLNVEFGAVDESNLRDEREMFLVRNMKAEQKRFVDALARRLNTYQDSIQKAASHRRNSDSLKDRLDQLELLLLKK